MRSMPTSVHGTIHHLHPFDLVIRASRRMKSPNDIREHFYYKLVQKLAINNFFEENLTEKCMILWREVQLEHDSKSLQDLVFEMMHSRLLRRNSPVWKMMMDEKLCEPEKMMTKMGYQKGYWYEEIINSREWDWDEQGFPVIRWAINYGYLDIQDISSTNNAYLDLRSSRS